MFSYLKALQAQFQVLELGVLFTSFNVQPNLIERITSSQKDDQKLVAIIDKVKMWVKSDFVLMNDDTLKFKNRLCIPHSRGLMREILKEFHNFRFIVHPRGIKMYGHMKQLYLMRTSLCFALRSTNCSGLL